MEAIAGRRTLAVHQCLPSPQDLLQRLGVEAGPALLRLLLSRLVVHALSAVATEPAL